MENARLDRIDLHLEVLKKSNISTNEKLDKISNALTGNEFTGGIGLVHMVNKLRAEVQTNKDDIDILKENLSIIKWIASGMGGLVIAIIIFLIERLL